MGALFPRVYQLLTVATHSLAHNTLVPFSERIKFIRLRRH